MRRVLVKRVGRAHDGLRRRVFFCFTTGPSSLDLHELARIALRIDLDHDEPAAGAGGFRPDDLTNRPHRVDDRCACRIRW